MLHGDRKVKGTARYGQCIKQANEAGIAVSSYYTMSLGVCLFHDEGAMKAYIKRLAKPFTVQNRSLVLSCLGMSPCSVVCVKVVQGTFGCLKFQG